MDFQVPVQIKQLQPPITYQDQLLVIGSCFTEHIGNYLKDVKFNVLQNPNGILFDPLSVCSSLVSFMQKKIYTEDELIFLDDVWHSWNHHSRFSGLDKQQVLDNINQSQQKAHDCLKQAQWLIITLGSSFVYKLADGLRPVANCHKAPAQTFIKHLCTIEETVVALDGMLHQLFHFNARINILFTISPVRHIRDGVIENNRSKARLIEAVHHLVGKFSRIHYFPAYELVIDVLRDYRFYDIDMVHPNYAGTRFVLEKFEAFCLDPEAVKLAEQIRKVVVARQHKAFNPSGKQHQQFLQTYLQKTIALQAAYPYLNFEKELEYFKQALV